MPSGLVCGINPGEGSEVATSTPISLQISQGPETKTAEVPDLGGLSLEKARTKLEEAGLKVGEITYRSSESSTDPVIGQDPVFGSQVSEGSDAYLTLSSGDRDIGSVQLYITLPENRLCHHDCHRGPGWQCGDGASGAAQPHQCVEAHP